MTADIKVRSWVVGGLAHPISVVLTASAATLTLAYRVEEGSRGRALKFGVGKLFKGETETLDLEWVGSRNEEWICERVWIPMD